MYDILFKVIRPFLYERERERERKNFFFGFFFQLSFLRTALQEEPPMDVM